MTVSTSFQIECISEPGKDYRVEIKESGGEHTSKPGKDYRVTETGVSLYIKWAKPELNNVDGDLRGASFIQSEMISQKKQKEKKKRDEITIIYRKDPTVIYTEFVSQLNS